MAATLRRPVVIKSDNYPGPKKSAKKIEQI